MNRSGWDPGVCFEETLSEVVQLVHRWPLSLSLRNRAHEYDKCYDDMRIADVLGHELQGGPSPQLGCER